MRKIKYLRAKNIILIPQHKTSFSKNNVLLTLLSSPPPTMIKHCFEVTFSFGLEKLQKSAKNLKGNIKKNFQMPLIEQKESQEINVSIDYCSCFDFYTFHVDTWSLHFILIYT